MTFTPLCNADGSMWAVYCGDPPYGDGVVAEFRDEAAARNLARSLNGMELDELKRVLTTLANFRKALNNRG